MPGLIDAHVHFRDPGLTHKEDFKSGSEAAARGGVTTFIDMPNVSPAMVTRKLLEERRELAKKSIVDYGFHFGASPEDIDEISKAKNVASTKVFFNISTGKLMITDDKALESIFQASKIITVHAEDEQVERAINIAKKTNKPVFLCHVSQKSELDMIKKSGYKKFFVEVTPHHLFLTEADKSYLNIMKPPLRTKADQDALWQAIQNGEVDTIGTDHAPHLESEKKEKETYGVPGIETMLPLLLNAHNEGKISLNQIQKLTSENPARIFKIQHKGFLKPGFDADLTIIDLNLKQKVKKEHLKTKCKWSPFEGKVLKGWPITTIVRGRIVYNQDKVLDNKGREVEFKC